MPPFRRVVLDVLKPHDPPVASLARTVAGVDGVGSVNATLLETDAEVQNVKLTVEGEAVPVDGLTAAIEELGGSVHSVDQVVCGDRLIESVETPQD